MYSVLIVAAGNSSRTKMDKNKVLVPLYGLPVIEYTLRKVALLEECCEIVICASSKDFEEIARIASKYKNTKVIQGGARRQDSVRNGLLACTNDYVLIHDAARPYVEVDDFKNVYDALVMNGHCAYLANKVVNTIRDIEENTTLDRSRLVNALTPQGVKRMEEVTLLEKASDQEFPDDAAVFTYGGYPPSVVLTENENKKITYQSDLESIALGHGYDIHRMIEGDGIVLGGVKIPCNKAFVAHSDGDVLIHALINAIYGAIGGCDIGEHFPNNSDKYKDIDSKILLNDSLNEMKNNGFVMFNMDASIVLENPKLTPYKNEIKESMINLLNIPNVNIKANTNEELGEIGKGEACACFVTVLLKKVLLS